MKRFKYTGFKSDGGGLVEGIMDAEDMDKVCEALRSKSIYPTSVTEISQEGLEDHSQGPLISYHLQKLVREKDLDQDRRKMYNLIAEGIRSDVPILTNLKLISEKVSFEEHKALLIEVYDKIRAGDSFSIAFNEKVPAYELLALTVGEEMGNLVEVLSVLGKFQPNKNLQDDFAYVFTEIGGMLVHQRVNPKRIFSYLGYWFESKQNFEAAEVFWGMSEETKTKSFSEIISTRTQYFPPHFISIMKDGELSGDFEKSFNRCRELILKGYQKSGLPV
ncbi:MAG: type II secretion system F family protein [Candidatus Paceibacterota bacterium]